MGGGSQQLLATVTEVCSNLNNLSSKVNTLSEDLAQVVLHQALVVHQELLLGPTQSLHHHSLPLVHPVTEVALEAYGQRHLAMTFRSFRANSDTRVIGK